MASVTTAAVDRRAEAGINDLRAENYTPAAIAVSVAAFVATAGVFPHAPEMVLLWPPIVWSFALAGYWLLSRSVRLASATFVAGMLVAETSAIWVFPGTPLAAAYAPIVLITNELLGRRASLFVAAIASAFIIAAHSHSALTLSAEIELVSLALVWSVCGISWLTTRSLYTTLDWAWYNFLQATGTVAELRQRQGELVRALKDLSDVTYRLEEANAELERARAAAQEAYRLKAQFASTISHELRTPLNLIIGFSEMLATAPHAYAAEALAPEYQCDVESIYRNARHLSMLIDDILDLSQIDAGRLTLSRESADLPAIADQATAALGDLLESRHLKLTTEIDDGVPKLMLDPTRIRQVFINLLSNAVRFTEQGGVTLRAWRDDGQVVVSVSDTGIGIAPEDVPKVFEPFRQADGSIRRRFGGSGLGLTISKEIVELHGGNMWVESTVGKGSTFYFSLPLARTVVGGLFRREWETWARTSPGAKPRQDTVMVLDRDPEGRGFQLFRRYLDGWRVIWAPSATELTRVREHSSVRALIVTDGRDDLPSLRAALGLADSVPIVVSPLTGPSALRSELNVFEYLTKPILATQMASALKRIRHVKTVLVVDDDPETVRLIGRMVRSALRRSRIIGAFNGVEAMAVLRNVRPDVIVLDLLMPEVDGYGLLDFLQSQERLRDVPVIVVTAIGKRSEERIAQSLTLSYQRAFGVKELTDVLQANLSVLKSQSVSIDQEPREELAESLA